MVDSSSSQVASSDDEAVFELIDSAPPSHEHLIDDVKVDATEEQVVTPKTKAEKDVEILRRLLAEKDNEINIMKRKNNWLQEDTELLRSENQGLDQSLKKMEQDHEEEIDEVYRMKNYAHYQLSTELRRVEKQLEVAQVELLALQQTNEKNVEVEEPKEEQGKDAEEKKSTKEKNRAAFCSYYKNVHTEFSGTDYDELITVFLIIVDLLASMYSLHGTEWKFCSLTVSFIAITLALLFESARGWDGCFARKKSVERIAAQAAIFGLNVALSLTSSDKHFWLIAAKITLGFIITLSFRCDAQLDTFSMARLLEKASGLDLALDSTTSDTDSSAELTPTVEAVPESVAEARIVELTKKASEEIGLIISKSTSATLIVEAVMPRSIAEKQGEILVDDEIVSINGVNMEGASVEVAQFLIKNIDGPFKMEVRQNANVYCVGMPHYL